MIFDRASAFRSEVRKHSTAHVPPSGLVCRPKPASRFPINIIALSERILRAYATWQRAGWVLLLLGQNAVHLISTLAQDGVYLIKKPGDSRKG